MRSSQASKLMTKNERCGWYCRVLKEGQITPGDPITLIAGSRDTTVREDARRLLKRS
jgi:MOSC domain-containing protein YiiM